MNPRRRRRAAALVLGVATETDDPLVAAFDQLIDGLPRQAFEVGDQGGLERLGHGVDVTVGAAEGLDQDAFERKLMVVRKYGTRMVRESARTAEQFYICSLSSRTLPKTSNSRRRIRSMT